MNNVANPAAPAPRIRRIRTLLLGWTQARMAQEMGVSIRTLARYESGKAPRHAIKLAEHLVPAGRLSRRAKGSAPAP